MKQKTQVLIGIIGFVLGVGYLLMNSNYYRMTQLDHLDDRIRFGRLQFYKKANVTLGKMQIHNRQKVFTVNFDGQQVFVGHMQHFLILMQAKGKITANGGSFYDIQDNIQKLCKIQRVLNINPDYQRMSIQVEGNFQDCRDAKYVITFTQTSDNKLKIHLKAPQKYQRAYLLFNHEEQNQYYGLGQQFSYLNLGQNRPYSTFTRQKGLGRGQQPLTLLANILHGAGGSYYTSYAPMPIWFSSKRIAYVLNSHHYMAWISNKVLVWSNDFTITYIKGQSYNQLVEEIAQINGYTVPVPDWVNEGAIVGLQGETQVVLEKYLQLKRQGAKIAGIWIQDWVSKRESLGYSRLWWNWQLDNQHYKNWDKLKAQLKSDNVQILIYINPMLSDANQKVKIKKNYYQIAEQMGYFVKLKTGQQYKTRPVSDFNASLIDFRNQEATKFFKYLIQHALNDTGAKGMMVDFSQAYPVDGVAATIEEGAYRHNQYPTLYHQKINAMIKEILGDDHDFYIFTRAGHLNSPRYSHSLWAGDQAMNFNFHTGLPSCLTAILSSGLVGYSNTHCDIGGYMHLQSDYLSFTHRTQVLLVRWMQLSAFTSVFRTHEGNLPDQTLQVYSNDFLSRVFAFYSHVFSALSQYRKQQIKTSSLKKLPLVRPLFLELEGIQGTADVQDQFFLGSQIHVAPFLTQYSQRKYFLPKGEWRAIWDGKLFKGCNCQRVWKQVLPPVFIRTSSPFCEAILQEISGLIIKYQDVVYKIQTDTKKQL